MTEKKWSYCQATYNAGASYTVGGVRFTQGVPKRVTSVAVRKALNGIQGFLLRDFFKDVPVNARDSEQDSESESESETVGATTKKKKTVKKVRVKGGE